MITVKCIQKFKDEHNNIYGYRLVDINGQTQDVASENLKKAIINKQVHVINLKLTSDRRLIDSEEPQLKSKTLGKAPVALREETPSISSEQIDSIAEEFARGVVDINSVCKQSKKQDSIATKNIIKSYSIELRSKRWNLDMIVRKDGIEISLEEDNKTLVDKINISIGKNFIYSDDNISKLVVALIFKFKASLATKVFTDLGFSVVESTVNKSILLITCYDYTLRAVIETPTTAKFWTSISCEELKFRKEFQINSLKDFNEMSKHIDRFITCLKHEITDNFEGKDLVWYARYLAESSPTPEFTIGSIIEENRVHKNLYGRIYLDEQVDKAINLGILQCIKSHNYDIAATKSACAALNKEFDMTIVYAGIWYATVSNTTYNAESAISASEYDFYIRYTYKHVE